MGLVTRGNKRKAIYDGLHVCLRPVALPGHFLTEVKKDSEEEDTEKKSKQDNGLFPIGMCTDKRIEFVVELVSLKQLAKQASKAKKEKEKLDQGDAILNVYDPWKKVTSEVGCMQASFNEVYEFEDQFIYGFKPVSSGNTLSVGGPPSTKKVENEPDGYHQVGREL